MEPPKNLLYFRRKLSKLEKKKIYIYPDNIYIIFQEIEL